MSGHHHRLDCRDTRSANEAGLILPSAVHVAFAVGSDQLHVTRSGDRALRESRRGRAPLPALLGMSQWRVTVAVSTDAAAFTSFIEDVGRQLRQALVAAYGLHVGAEITADAFAYAWEHWGRISEMDNPAGYLYRVAQSSARRGIFRPPPRLDPAIVPTETHWFEPDLAPAIASLSDKQRAAVILVHGYGWTITEVAEMWGVSFSTVKSHIDRAMKRLRRKLGVEE